MAGAFDDRLATQIRYPWIHRGQPTVARKGKHEVFFAGDEKGGLLDFSVASAVVSAPNAVIDFV
jgi:hypothetical protein